MGSLSTDRRGVMVVLSSPSGAGKTTISKLLLKRDYLLMNSISVTTRLPRANERDGIDYHFVSVEKFKQLIKENAFLEYARVFDNYYGTLHQTVDDILNQGKDVLFDIDWQGNKQLTESARNDLVSIFIMPPSVQELKRRLYSRGLDSAEIIQSRLKLLKNDLLHWNCYDYVIVNDDIEESYRKILSIIETERLRRTRQKNLEKFMSQMISDSHQEI